VDLPTALVDGVVRKVRTTVVLAPTQDVLIGRLGQVTEEDITVVLDASAPRLPGGQMCCVTFCHDGRSVAFLARLVEHTGIALRFRRPKDGMVYQGRQRFRVPIIAGSGLVVQVGPEDGLRASHPLDISMGGVGVRFGSTVKPGWDMGQEVLIKLERNGIQAKLLARVVWVRRDIYGFAFYNLRRSEFIGELTQLVCDLEFLWMDAVS
jgi:c-di-GMP-binding flagellar brake protein YcgR